jgi:N-acetylmuramoyl-L-alanine amidase
MTSVYPVRGALALVSTVVVCALAGCSGSVVKGTAGTALSTSPITTEVPAPSSSAATRSTAATSRAATRPTPTRTSAAPATSASASSASSAAPAVPAGTGPLIVIDPGHSVTVHGTDPATGLDVSDYENEPEMTDVFAVAKLVRQRLVADGYRVLMTKTSNGAPTTLGRRAQVANDAHAALAVSIHDQAGSGGGLPFATANNIVYYQSVGDYRTTPSGRKVVFTNAAVAATSKRYGEIFQAARASREGHSVALQGDTGYDLGSRGLQGGNIWIVQLLSTVPWIYCEAGGNSAGRSGLDSSDRQRYVNGIVAGIERSVPAR